MYTQTSVTSQRNELRLLVLSYAFVMEGTALKFSLCIHALPPSVKEQRFGQLYVKQGREEQAVGMSHYVDSVPHVVVS